LPGAGLEPRHYHPPGSPGVQCPVLVKLVLITIQTVLSNSWHSWTRAQPLGVGGSGPPKTWMEHPNFLMKSMITVTLQTAVHETGISVFCSVQ